MLPRVKIDFQNGTLGSVAPSEDGVCGLLTHATAINTTFALQTPYLLTKLADLTDLGFAATDTGANGNVYKIVKEFYDEAPEGSKLWLIGVADSVSYADLCDKANPYAASLLDAAGGAIRILMVHAQAPGTASYTNGGAIDDTAFAAISKLQQLADDYTERKYAPFLGIIEGLNYSGTPANLIDLGLSAYNRVAVVIGDTKPNSNYAAIGLVAGRLAAKPVQRSLARVKDGSIAADIMYLGSDRAELGSPQLLHDAGYICPRTFVGKAGYYWSDDKLATSPTDDYALIPRRRTIDKAYRIAYRTLVEKLGDEIPVTDQGTIVASVAKAWETDVIAAITNEMTANGELGNDPESDSDRGVRCTVDLNSNIAANSTVNLALQVKPYGYAKYIDVKLGFLIDK
jgi:hypothetical protein